MIALTSNVRTFSRLTLAFALVAACTPAFAGNESLRRADPALARSTGRTPTAEHAAAASSLIISDTARMGATLKLPPLPGGIEELAFGDFFQKPIGPGGLEISPKLRQLDGHRVRILGYMVDQSQPAPRCLLLAPLPVKLHEDEWGFSEDLPASVVHVFVDSSAPETVPFTPGPLLLTGTLQVGNRAEPDQRISTVRLQLDPPARMSADASAAHATIALQPERDATKR